ncbi:hypothetical protein ACFCXT_35855, partial [Streptomyces vinaceus]|uniref:hypothetical protein n=1 Tax=Streptomyces vinaceus TaxID=1960 RepID=UPI0035D7825D
GDQASRSLIGRGRVVCCRTARTDRRGAYSGDQLTSPHQKQQRYPSTAVMRPVYRKIGTVSA